MGSRTSFDLALGLFVTATVSAGPAFAYRPFDGTDADVAAEGEFELELGPAQYLSQPDGHYIVAPATVLNLGITRGFELVVDFKNFISIDSDPQQSRVRLLDTDIFIKSVLRRGVLQGDTGLSIALEAGPLLPEPGGSSNFGAQINLINSYKWTALTLHLNTSAAVSREHNFDGFASIIAEGPRDWVVRPVAELYVSGADLNSPGTCTPKIPSTSWRYPDQPLATVAPPTAYSSIRSHPMIHAKSSPRVV